MSQPSVQLKFLIKYKQINLCWWCCCCVAVAGKIYFFFPFYIHFACFSVSYVHIASYAYRTKWIDLYDPKLCYSIYCILAHSLALALSPISPKFCIRNLNAVIEIILNISLRAHTLHFISFSLGVEICEIRIIPCAAAFLRIFLPVVVVDAAAVAIAVVVASVFVVVVFGRSVRAFGQRTQNIRSFNFSLINFSSPFNKKLIKWEEIMQKHN